MTSAVQLISEGRSAHAATGCQHLQAIVDEIAPSVNDADLVAVDEQDDAGSVVGSSEADVVHVAVDAQADGAVGDAVVADAELAVGVLLAG